MKLLLDTMHLSGGIVNPPGFRPKSWRFVGIAEYLLLSVVSVWEMQIKIQLGKLRLTLPLQEIIETQQQINAIEILPITLPHVLALENLPTYHKDPFDCLLVAQAIVEGVTLISGDSSIPKYAVQVIW